MPPRTSLYLSFFGSPSSKNKSEKKPNPQSESTAAIVVPPQLSPDDYGIKVLAEPMQGTSNDQLIDIVSVHGLAGHREKTWLHESTGHLWLRDFLPSAIPNARIMTYGYQSTLIGRNVLGIMENAEGLLASLQAARIEEQEQTRPLILIGHSLGGLVIKKALLQARDQNDVILNAVKVIVFMAVPHRGADIAKYATYLATLGNIGIPVSKINLEELQTGSRPLVQLGAEFAYIHEKYKYITVLESERTGVGLPRGSVLVVPQNSARLNFGLREKVFSISGADHRTVCKFASKDGMYATLSAHLVHLAKEAVGGKSSAGVDNHLDVEGSLSRQRTPSPSALPLSHVDQECLQALANADVDVAAKKASIPQRAPGTCEWFLSNEKYLSWLTDPESSLLWVSGHPGCGKTVLASFLIDHLKEIQGGSKRGVVCYFFCDDKLESFHQAISILRATLHMLFTARRELLKYAIEQFQSKGQGFSKELITMWNILLDAASDENAGIVYCVVDAINECESKSRETLLQLVTSYFGKTTIGGGHLKLLMTSRPEISVIEELAGLSSNRLRTEDENENIDRDVRTAVKYGLRKYAETSHCSESFRERLEEILLGNAEKTFLWVSLILRTLINEAGESEEALMTMVKEFPPKLDETYEAILNRIPPPQRLKTKKILSAVISALRPLTAKELNMSLAVHLGDLSENQVRPRLLTEPIRIIQRACGALVRIYEGKIYLVHQTAKEFLLKKSESVLIQGRWKCSLDPAEAHMSLGQSCIWYLQFNEFLDNPLPYDHQNAYTIASKQRMAAYNDRNIFLEYSARFWMNHFRDSQAIADNGLIDCAVTLCDTRSRRFWTWFQIHWILSDFTWGPCPRGLSALGIAGLFGLDAVGYALLKRSAVDPEEGDSHKRTPLSWAAEMGREEMVRMLVNTPGVDVESKDDRGRTPLIWAALLGQTRVVQYLIEDAKAKVDCVDSEMWTPLSWAALFGHTDTANFLVLQPKVQVEHKDVLGRTPLALAALNGHEKLVRLLSSRNDVDSDSKDILGKTPLLRAAQEGHESVVRLLLEKAGVKADSKDVQSRTPLSWAAGNGHERVVRLLLERNDVDADSEDVFGVTPIAWATQGGYIQIVELLNTRKDIRANFTEQQREPPEVDPVELLEKDHEAVVARMLVTREHCTVEYLLRFAPSWGRFDNEEWYQTVEIMLASRSLDSG